MHLHSSIVLLGALAMSACAQPQGTPKAKSVEVCNSSGCGVQSSKTQTFDPSAAVPDEDPNGMLPALTAAAEADPRAAFDLGLRYMRGDGLRQNSWKAIEWMRDAAERGELRAQSALGRLYMTGLEETGADFNEAERWLSIAADRGDREARTLLSEAQAGKAQQQASYNPNQHYRVGRYWYPIRVVSRWRRVYTRPYWYRTRYYGYWRPGLSAYAYF